MLIQDVINYLEEIAPSQYAESFDNVGLLVGNKNTSVTGILVTLDTLETVVDEAIQNNCNLIVSFHPIIFKGLKKLNGSNYVQRTVIKAIQNHIAIYAIHTALDNAFIGVNAMICNQLKLINKKILLPQKHTIKKLTTYAPNAQAKQVRQALFNAGAGAIGNYSNCSFNATGIGTFMAAENANPTIGEIGTNHEEAETKITVIFATHLEKKIQDALFKNHPYEEIAYEIITLNNTNQKIGMGMIGNLENEMPQKQFLEYVKKSMKTQCIRHSKITQKPIKKVAVLGGSGSFAIAAAKAAKADAFITADLKYHDFFTAENNILLTDIGHYESEQFTKNGLVALLTKKFTNFAVLLSQINTNPIKYF